MTSGFPDYSRKMFTHAENDEQVKVSVDENDSTGTFAQQVKSLLVYNDGPNPIHIKLDAEADTDNFKIPAKSGIAVDRAVTVVHLICVAGEEATVYLWGFW